MNWSLLLFLVIAVGHGLVVPEQFQLPLNNDAFSDAPHSEHENLLDADTQGNLTVQAIIDPGGLGVGPGSQQYSGYFTSQQRGNLFFWMFMSRNRNPAEAPVVLWLNGGPGCSSLYGALAQWGPSLVVGPPGPNVLAPNPHTLITDVCGS